MDIPAYWLLVGCGKVWSDIDHGRDRMGFKGEATGAADHRHTVPAPFGRWAGKLRSVLTSLGISPILNTVQRLI